MSLRNLSIAPRAALGFALITALLVFTGLFSLSRMANINEATIEISENWLPSVKLSAQLNAEVAALRLSELAHTLSVDEPGMRSLEQDMQTTLAKLSKAESAYETLITSSEERQLYERYQQEKRAYLSGHDAWLPLSKANKTDEAFAQLRGPMAEAHKRLSATTEAIVELNSRGAAKASQSADANYTSAMTAVISILVASGVLTVILAWLLTRSITLPLGQAVRVAEIIARGDLTSSIDTSGRDEPAKLLGALQMMQQQLRSTIQQIGSSATQLASAAEQLSVVTEESNRALTQQNDEIQMAATAVNQMTAAVEEVARNASSTSDASRASETSAQAGRDRVIETVQAIRSMSEEVGRTANLVEGLANQAQSISKVLDVIRAIAEQTNLLALNAAIEAARAGEQGRGFAVVADEVRALAHRTQESTREIEQMIASIQNGTNEAVDAMGSSNQRTRSMLDIAEAAGSALQEITAQVSQINERTLVIASAAEEQAQVAREVDRNLVNIRDIAEQSTAGANETAASSQELSRLAIELNGMVTRFVV